MNLRQLVAVTLLASVLVGMGLAECVIAWRRNAWRSLLRDGAMVSHPVTMYSGTTGFPAASIAGIPWMSAPLPPRWHRCRTWSITWTMAQDYERCACGALLKGRTWMFRNERRRAARRDALLPGTPRVAAGDRTDGRRG